jgi:large subunit ribosomal protein L2
MPTYYVDYFRRLNLLGFILKIQKVPFYTGNLGLIIYQNGLSNFILLAEDLKLGDYIFVGTQLIFDKEISCKKNGSALPISYIPLFSKIHNLELYPFKGGQ